MDESFYYRTKKYQVSKSNNKKSSKDNNHYRQGMDFGKAWLSSQAKYMPSSSLLCCPQGGKHYKAIIRREHQLVRHQ